MNPASAAPSPIVHDLQGLSQGFDTATYKRTQSNATIVTLQKKEGGKDHWITVTFQKPIDEDEIVQFLNTKNSKEKIEQLVKQFDLFLPLYGGKANFHIESMGKNTYLFFEKSKKKETKRIDLSESKYQETQYRMAEDYQRKIKAAQDSNDEAKLTKLNEKKDKFLRVMKEFAKISKTIKTPLPKADEDQGPAFQLGLEPPT